MKRPRKRAKSRCTSNVARATRSWTKPLKFSNSLRIQALPDKPPSIKSEPKPSGFWTAPKSTSSPTISPLTSNSMKPPFNGHHIDELASQFKRHLRPINASVDWAASARHSAVIEASDFLKNAFNRGRSLGQYASRSLPQHFIPDTAKRYLYELDASGPKTPAAGSL